MLSADHFSSEDTIVAPATAPGVGAIAVIRVSGKEAFEICNKVFFGKDLHSQPTHTIHFGTIRDNGSIVDEVLVSLFKGPKSFTKEDVIEISCHGSEYIVNRIIKLLIRNGARFAEPGEFTKRAFMHGKFDLAQAEAVADLIAADSASSHQLALSQMRGGFSNEIKKLREDLIHFASMIELELDFGEEDVEFADRDDLKKLIYNLLSIINPLIESFDLGNVIKNGVPTVIAGKPNAGKSTLLNTLLNEEKAIVSDIPGTTRDSIEDEINIEGMNFRFIDTAGLRETTDKVEAIGVQRTRDKMSKASLILYMFDAATTSDHELGEQRHLLSELGIPYILIGNKLDQLSAEDKELYAAQRDVLLISAEKKENIDLLKKSIVEHVNLKKISTANVVVSNVRHYDMLVKTRDALGLVLDGLDSNITGDFLAMDIRNALHFLGEITGEITTDDLLANIFSKFCIGK
ncbi:MAG TPA: tRNA uridine-5-carboxymethylaminomethyl(34) synthesis GTPase MnmE [Cytophagales bacterium]|nr:tRNA uridine-5-carboxymethylaminomethyl(34) synthesis GTPase MnmE [Cytophagales bacterium]